jgi:hypothetical protein
MRSITVGAACALLALTAPADAQPGPPAPGEGVMCALAAAEVGRRCFAGKDPALQEELGRSAARLEEYVLANAQPSVADMVRVEASRDLAKRPDGKLCAGDLTPLYESLRTAGPERLRSETDRLVAKPGKPTWGACQ